MCLLCVKEVFCLRHPLVSTCFSLTVIHAKTLTKMHTEGHSYRSVLPWDKDVSFISGFVSSCHLVILILLRDKMHTHTPLQFLCLVSLYKDIFCGSLSTTGKRFLTCSNRYPDMPLQVFTSPSYVCTIYRKLYRKCWTRLRVRYEKTNQMHIAYPVYVWKTVLTIFDGTFSVNQLGVTQGWVCNY